MSRNTTDPAGDRGPASAESPPQPEETSARTYRCSICGQAVGYVGGVPALYPFCCERCKLIDLGRWFNEQYSIDRDLAPEDIAEFRQEDSRG